MYLKVCDLLQNKIEVDVPAEILNNIGSLYFVLGDLKLAKVILFVLKKALFSNILKKRENLSFLKGLKIWEMK